jgi:hypothetical protein
VVRRKEMTTAKEAIEFIEANDATLNYLRERVKKAEDHVAMLQDMTSGTWLNPEILRLEKQSYTRSEIVAAFEKAKMYEGLLNNEFATVLDTFIEFLDEKKKTTQSGSIT